VERGGCLRATSDFCHLSRIDVMSEAIAIEFDNVAMSVTNIDRSVEWYERVFGFKRGYRTFIDTLQADFQILQRPELQIELLSRRGAVRDPEADAVAGPHLEKSGLTAIVFRTADLEAATSRLEDLGVTFVWKLQLLSADGLRSTMVRDPDGTLINILRYPSEA
jgi:catechol 2,3-dioxygenase-like lactoylglutathione lyase family enzyme